MVDARKEFLNAGMNGFVAKPIDFARICNQLKLWLPKDLVRDVPKEEAKKLLAEHKLGKKTTTHGRKKVAP